MDAEEIITSIKSIYDRFSVMPNLQEHMFRVAAVGSLICDNWTGPEINSNLIISVLLVHDLGNIVKFRLDTPESERMIKDFGGEGTDWTKVQEDTKKRYGANDHAATRNMVIGLGVSKRFLQLLDGTAKLYHSVDEVLRTDDLELKLCCYPDERVGPYGVISAKQRLDDLINRYKDNKEKLETYSKIAGTVPEFEQQLFRHIRIRPEQINDETVMPYMQKLKH
ncbi:MAG: hypothetical protein KGH60_03175 [Candidatus Micrarchaeota archaeon]|nr:hypothetical protein [Candidatus Micrarchaeota archaeon]